MLASAVALGLVALAASATAYGGDGAFAGFRMMGGSGDTHMGPMAGGMMGSGSMMAGNSSMMGGGMHDQGNMTSCHGQQQPEPTDEPVDESSESQGPAGLFGLVPVRP